MSSGWHTFAREPTEWGRQIYRWAGIVYIHKRCLLLHVTSAQVSFRVRRGSRASSAESCAGRSRTIKALITKQLVQLLAAQWPVQTVAELAVDNNVMHEDRQIYPYLITWPFSSSWRHKRCTVTRLIRTSMLSSLYDRQMSLTNRLVAVVII